MTAQLFDIVIFEGESYKLVASANELPFKVEAFNIEPVWTSTSCFRGFVRTFIVENKKLSITQLDVNDKKLRSVGVTGYQPNAIYGSYPKINYPPGSDTLFEMIYKGLNHEIDFTGSILIGKTFYFDLADHLGGTNWRQNETYELAFDKGILVACKDMADSLNEMGASMNRLGLKRGTPEFDQWLTTTALSEYYHN